MYNTKEISACTICDCESKAFERHFFNQNILNLDKLINQQEGILCLQVISDMYLLGDILTDRHNLHRYQLRNDEHLRIPTDRTTQLNFLFVIEL